MTKKNNNHSSRMNEGQFDLNEHSREVASTEHERFAPLDTPPGIGLRQFLDRETRLQAASGGSSTTLIPGRLYLRQQPSGLWELTHSRGRGFFDCYVGETAEELIELARSMNLLSSED